MELTPLPPKSPLAPTEQEVALLNSQYHKALDGLYEAYRFGMMLLRVRERLEALAQRTADSGQRTAAFRDGVAEGLESDPQESPENQGSFGDAARGTAERSYGKNAIVGGWNAGTGLKGWLGVYCPEIHYSTARRFLSVAEKTNAALALAGEQRTVKSEAIAQELCQHGEQCADATDGLTAGEGDGLTAQTGEGPFAPAPFTVHRSPFTDPAEPSEAAVRAYLAGKSQRQVLKAPKERAVRHAMGPEEHAEKLAEVCKGFLLSLEGIERTRESDILRLEDRREIVTRLKALARRLEEAGR